MSRSAKSLSSIAHLSDSVEIETGQSHHRVNNPENTTFIEIEVNLLNVCFHMNLFNQIIIVKCLNPT